VNWDITLEYGGMTGTLFIKTEFGPAWLRIRKISENIWAFKGGTISCINKEWRGGIEVGYHRYFIRPDNTLAKKASGHSGLNPYTYYRKDGKLYMRLWENKLVVMDYDSEIVYRGIVYRLSGREIGTVTPIRSEFGLSDEAIQSRAESLTKR